MKEKITAFIGKLKIYIRLPLYLIFIVSTIGAFYLIATGMESTWKAIALESISGISFFLVIPVLGHFFPIFTKRLKEFFIPILNKFPLTRLLLNDPRARLLFTTFPAILGNLLIAAYNIYIWYYSHSPWFGSFAGYYLFIACLRGYNISENEMLRKKESSEDEETYVSIKADYIKRILFINAICFVILVGFVGGTDAMLVLDVGTKTYPDKFILIIALYSFVKIIAAIVSIINVRRYKSFFMSTMRQIGTVDALMSIYMLQVAMINAYGVYDDKTFSNTMNSILGIVICGIILVFALLDFRTAYIKHYRRN